MKVVFAAMGEENLGTGSISAVLKRAGHETALAFDPALFDERIYFHIEFLAKLFSQKTKVIDKIVRLKPDLLAISVFSDNYQWALEIARGVKKKMDVPVYFGGVFPTNSPEVVLGNDCVDIVCVGEGEMPTVELCDSMARGEIDYSIKNLYFKKDGEIIKNEIRPLQDLNTLPAFDKEIFKDDIIVKNRYYTLSSKGCAVACSYCSQSFYEVFNKGKDARRKAVDLMIDELVEAKEIYGVTLVDLEDNILFSNYKWFRDFAPKYKEKVDVPYICMGHPLFVTDETARLLKESGCYRLQLGIQSLDEKNRKDLLHRPETNERILEAFRHLDNHGVRYSVDHIFGLPNERDEEHLYEAAKVYCQCKSLHKVNCFFLTCFPKTPMIDYAIKYKMIKPEDRVKIDEGHQDFYYDYGITTDPELKRLFRTYAIFFRLIPVMSERMRKWFLDKRIMRYFRWLPKIFTMFCVDMYLTFRNWDPVSRHLLNQYLMWLKRIMFEGGVK